MPRKKIEENPDTAVGAPQPAQNVEPSPPASPPADDTVPPPPRQWARLFKSVLALPAKGVTLGVRDGHDWVIGFPQDPGPEVKQQLSDAGFSYRTRDRKWTTFTHAPNRPEVEGLAKQLKGTFGEEVAINDYPVKQVVVAFDANPGEQVTAELQEKGFHFRPDQTWNAEFTPEAQTFARELTQSLPEKSCGSSVGRR